MLKLSERLVISEATTKKHVARILQKLGLRDREQAVIYAYETGLLTLRADEDGSARLGSQSGHSLEGGFLRPGEHRPCDEVEGHAPRSLVLGLPVVPGDGRHRGDQG